MPGLTFTVADNHNGPLSRTDNDSSRDPNHLPSVASSPSPSHILYLPPLLSSLPAPHHTDIEPLSYPPLITETRLPEIDPASLSLHHALHYFRPIDDQYATRPYFEAFNWAQIQLPAEDEREWYCVAFRSVRKDGSDGSALYEADKEAHDEAIRNGGIIMYWYGVPSPGTGQNLATCIWQSRQHAILASTRPNHIRAAKLAKGAYATYQLERWVIRKIRGETGIHLDPYKDGPVGW